MPVKIKLLGPNNPQSPAYADFPEDGFVVSADDSGFVNVLLEHAWQGVEMIKSVADDERISALQSVISAVETAHHIGHDALDQEGRENLYDDVGTLFAECLRTLGISADNQELLKPFTAYFDVADPRPHDAQGNLLQL